ncbi:hypothetical protein J2S55_000228 [Streptosporangium brasiliense]|uniref:Uncharacterized protein n=1 Tax=Streptosporangium brasiliense TaxID=47480 RepID=A0ABT9QVI1_9ACTN|nr:hypothetical protein [Streptosporangium brasiliense]
MAEVVAIMTGALRVETGRGAVVTDEGAARAVGLS